MLRMVAVGMTALFVTGSTLAYAQAPAPGLAPDRLSIADLSALTEARIAMVRFALQLSPDQEKYWPAIEDAIRTGAKERQDRLANAAARLTELRDRSPSEALRDANLVEFFNRRSEALTRRAAELKKLADAWRPLYQTLNPDQKRRLAFVAITALQ